VPIASRFLLSLHCCDKFWAGQTLVLTFVGQQEPCRSVPSGACILDGKLKRFHFVTIPDHLIALSNQADVVIAGRLEPTFQPQTVVTGVHL
jgi:hypothetical protein